MSRRWLKAELHAHCNLDPQDHRICCHSAEELIANAARLDYQVVAITCHNLDVWSPELAEYAESHGITLIPGMEALVEGRYHALVYNFGAGAGDLDTLAKLRTRRREDTLVVAPHPYFPSRSCLGRLLQSQPDVFDAIEWSGFYTPRMNFNRGAGRFAAEHGKPMLGNSDLHFLWQLGRTFTWIDAEPEVESILSAIKTNRVRIETAPLTPGEAARWWLEALWRSLSPVQAKGWFSGNPRARDLARS